MDTFVIVNRVTGEPLLSEENLQAGVAALRLQNIGDFSPAWRRIPASFSVAAEMPAPTLDVHITEIVPEIPEAPTALAYHTIDEHGRPRLVIGWGPLVKEGGDADAALWMAASHEVNEEMADPYVCLEVRMPDGKKTVPFEVCDWVQGDGYLRGGKMVSNFVLPPFFDALAPGGTRLDQMGLCKHPFEIRPNGYTEVRFDNGRTDTIFGKEVSEVTRQRKRGQLRVHRHRAPRLVAA